MILVTGSSGFIGRHLLSALIQKYGAENILAFSSAPVSECRCLLHNNYNFDSDYFVNAGLGSTIHTIIHAGAFTPKNGAQANDWQKCNSNIINTDRLLNANLPALKKIIFLSTLDVYDKDDIITEQSPVKPASLYGESKLYCEKMIAAWAASSNKICQLLRVGHVYGPGEEAYQKVIPMTMMKLLEGKKIQIWGTGSELRSFIYIKDIVNAITASLNVETFMGIVNLVSGHKISIKELVEKLILISGKKPEIEIVPSTTPGRNFVFDNSKMIKCLKTSETPLDIGLSEEWNYMQGKSG